MPIHTRPPGLERAGSGEKPASADPAAAAQGAVSRFRHIFDPSSFQEGDFIDWKDPVYEVFLERARSQFLREEAEGRLSGTIELTAFYLKPVFESLLKYRIALDESLYFNSGVSEAGDLFYFEFLKINEMNRVIRRHLAIIDDLLVELISPTRQTFTRKQLVNEHGYPDVDLDEIDLDWF